MNHHEFGAQRTCRDELRSEHPDRLLPQFGVRGSEVYQVLRVYDHGIEIDLAGAFDKELGIRAGYRHGPTLGVRDEDLDRLQPLLPGEPKGFLETARGRQVSAYPVGARSCAGRGFGHAANSTGNATVPS